MVYLHINLLKNKAICKSFECKSINTIQYLIEYLLFNMTAVRHLK